MNQELRTKHNQRIGRPSCSGCNGSGRVVGGAVCGRCSDVIEMARDWLRWKCESPRRAASDPQDSHAVVLKAAGCLVVGFGLPDAVAEKVMAEYLHRSDEPWTEAEIARKFSEARRTTKNEVGWLIWRGGGSVATEGKREWAEMPKRPKGLEGKAIPYDVSALIRCQDGSIKVDRNWLAERSAVVPWKVSTDDFLAGLYEAGERVVVFNVFDSQGQWIWEKGVDRGQGTGDRSQESGVRGQESGDGGADAQQRVTTAGTWWQVGRNQLDVKRVAVGCPKREQREGMWFLAQPVTGGFKINGRKKDGELKFTRRSGCNVVRWRYMVIESDEKGIEPLWLNLLAQLPLPIVALYTSGGKSVHALVRLEARSKAEWDAMRDAVRPLLTKVGADEGVFSAVRLTRLPGFVRLGAADREGNYVRYEKGRLQELLFWDPENWGKGRAMAIRGLRRRWVVA